MSKLISIAIPCYKSANTIQVVVNEVRNTIVSRKGFDYQIILVNDFPYDDTFSVISDLCKEDKKIIGVNLSRNYGQSYAKLAALKYVTGDVLVYMDDDGQHPANEIYKLIDKVLDGYDLAVAHFSHKKHSLFKRVTSKIQRWLSVCNGTTPRDLVTSSYYAISSFVVNELKKYKSPFPSASSYTYCITQNYTNVIIEHRKRIEGKSNYSLIKLIRLWILEFFNYSMAPLRLATYIGFFCGTIGIIMGCVLIARKIFNPEIKEGYTSTIVAIFVVGGLLMLMIGILGEYVGRIYMTISNKPQYAIRTAINAKDTRNI